MSAKINTKGKGSDRSKGQKSAVPSNENSQDVDLSLLRKPILTSVTGFAQARKIYDWATEELKDLLKNECDLLYECKVCRNLFRSLANFVSHKRIYCKEKFSTTSHGHFVDPVALKSELQKIKQFEDSYQESLKKNNEAEIVEDNDDERIPLSKDLTTVLEKVANARGVPIEGSIHQVTLQEIPNSSVAKFQNFGMTQNDDSMKSQVLELDRMLAQTAVLQPDGRCAAPDAVIQISDDDDAAERALHCKICQQQFSTQKTLRVHTRTAHVASRLVYPCPDCADIFSTSWSVYRHLFKVHRKTAAQIRRARESIQTRAFRTDKPPPFYEKRKQHLSRAAERRSQLSGEQRADQENQAWMDKMQTEGFGQRCVSCGRGFERRAALAAHAAACGSRRRRPIHIQIRRDYHKGDDNKIPPDENAQSSFRAAAEAAKPALVEAVMTSLPHAPADSAPPSPDKSSDSQPEPEPRLPVDERNERVSSNLAALKSRAEADVDLGTLSCRKCDKRHVTPLDLYDHMAQHYRWMRFSCKLCNYKHYEFANLAEHVRIVHKLKGDNEFYYSTVKALDGSEALQCCESVEEDGQSPESRRPSRCSSDSSRVSDDSGSKVDDSRKRKMADPTSQPVNKRKRAMPPVKYTEEVKDNRITMDKVMQVIFGENDVSSSKSFEENSSDLDEDVRQRRSADAGSVATRRPVRNKTKRKNADFEYDLSNLLKMEAQGYREAQTGTVTKVVAKKKPQPDATSFDAINKDFSGALLIMSKKSALSGAAQLKAPLAGLLVQQKASQFAKPLPKATYTKSDKSPKKDVADKEIVVKSGDKTASTDDAVGDKSASSDKLETNNSLLAPDNDTSTEDSKQEKDNKIDASEPEKPPPGVFERSKDLPEGLAKKPTNMVPIKVRQQSLEIMKNSLLNKNITELKKAGMKTKILVIKPIKRNAGGKVTSTTVKFQTIKLKDPSKSTGEMVVKVPAVSPISAKETENSSKVITEMIDQVNGSTTSLPQEVDGDLPDSQRRVSLD